MDKLGFLVIRLVAVVVTIAAAISITYIWLLPNLLPGYKTYSFLMIGVVGGASLGVYISYQYAGGMSLINRVLLSALCGLVVAGLIGFLSFFAILNIKGS